MAAGSPFERSSTLSSATSAAWCFVSRWTKSILVRHRGGRISSERTRVDERRGPMETFGKQRDFSDLHRFACKSKLRNLARSFEDRKGRAVAHFSLSNNIVSSFMPRPRRMTPLIVVFSDSTTPKRTA